MVISNKWKRLLFSIICCVCVGILVHGFFISNKFYNHDDIFNMLQAQDLTSSGRWLLHISMAIESFSISTPWFSAMLGFLYIGIAIYLICEIFSIHYILQILAIASVMLTWVSLSATLLYTKFFSPYMFAFLLMHLALYLALQKNWALPLAVLAMVLSLACYQAYVGFYVGLCTLYFMQYCLKKGFDKALFLKMLKVILVFVLAMILYISITKILLNKQSLNAAYQGVDTMGTFTIESLFTGIGRAYTEFYQQFLGEEAVIFPEIMKPFIIVYLCLLLLWFIHSLFGKSILQVVAVGFAAFLLPLAFSIFHVMGIADIHVLIRYSNVLYFLMPLLFIDGWRKYSPLQKIIKFGMALLVSVLVFCNLQSISSTNMALYLAQKQADAYTSRLLLRIESTPGFESYDRVVFIGKSSLGGELEQLLSQTNFHSIAVSEISAPNMYSADKYINYFQGFYNFIYPVDSIDEMHSIKALQAVLTDELVESLQAMPVYPSDGSIVRNENGFVFVKLSEEY